MSLPGNALSPGAAVSALLAPDDIGRADPLVDYELGGIALSDPSQGLRIQAWRARVAGGTKVMVAPAPYSAEAEVFAGTGISEVSLSFDQNMRPCIAFVDGGVAKLYWYDPVKESTAVDDIGIGITSVFVAMDDKRPAASRSNTNDILLLYNRDGLLCYRQQRERFKTERVLATLLNPSGRIRRFGMSVGLRMQVEVIYPEAQE